MIIHIDKDANFLMTGIGKDTNFIIDIVKDAWLSGDWYGRDVEWQAHDRSRQERRLAQEIKFRIFCQWILFKSICSE